MFTENTKLYEILQDENAKEILEKYAPDVVKSEYIELGKQLTIGTILSYSNSKNGFTNEKFLELLDQLNGVEPTAKEKEIIPFRWLFVGSGIIALMAARSVLQIEGQSLAGVYSPTYENAKRFADKFDSIAYTSLSEALASKDFDGVYISSTNNAHLDNVLQCLSKQIPVLCEKPFALNANQATIMFDEAKQQNVYCAEAMWTWFANTANKVKSWIDGGSIGDVVKVEMVYSNGFAAASGAPSRDRLTNINKGGGALLDIGVYPIFYCCKLLGYPQNIVCQGQTQNGIDLSENIILTYPNNVVCNIEISFTEFKGEYAVIYGTEGRIEVPNFHSATKATVYKYKTGIEHFVDNGFEQTNLMTQQFFRVAKEVREGKKESHFVSHRDTIYTHRVMDECRKQLGVVYPNENINSK